MADGESGQAQASYLGVRDDLIAMIPDDLSPRKVLEVGCAEGATGATIKDAHPECRVTGIEIHPPSAEKAAERLDEVHQGDAMHWLAELVKAGKEYDLVLLGDVLEHLEDPWRALSLVRELCTGHAVISLPNIAHFSNLVSIFFRGEFPYRERGIQDRTHLRFFSRNNLEPLFSQAGFTEVKRSTHHRVIERPHPSNKKWEPIVRHLPLVRRWTEYQYLSLLK